MYKIAVDAMGGDNAPQSIVEGVLLAAKQFEDVEYVLYGDVTEIKRYIPNSESRDVLDKITFIHTTEKINSEDEPVKAIRSKKQASMVLAAQAIKEQKQDALFSAGNTGALLAAGLFIVGRIKGIDRPALMPTLPVFSDTNKQFLMLDVGANAQSQVKNLHQFALLGNYYAKKVLQINNPKIGLLNNGTEETKGNDLTKQVYPLLKSDKSLNFIGNVEARELMNGIADIVVTDGFTGNAVLKTIEGTALSLNQLIKETIKHGNVKTKIGGLLIKNTLSGLKQVLDYSRHGGAVLLGLKSPIVKTHGSADKVAVYYTIKQIRTILKSGVIPEVVKYFEKVDE